MVTLGPTAQTKLMIPMFSLPLSIFHYSCKQFEATFKPFCVGLILMVGYGVFLGEILLFFYKEMGNYLELAFLNINLSNLSFFGLNFTQFLYERIFLKKHWVAASPIRHL